MEDDKTMKKIYIATPVNARKEVTLQQKQRAARYRALRLKSLRLNIYPKARFWASVINLGIARRGHEFMESFIMGECIEHVIDCDIIVLDEGWKESIGCTCEHFVAQKYGKEIIEYSELWYNAKREQMERD